MGLCHRQFGEYDKALAYYKKIVNNWPDWVHAGSAQYLIARCYEQQVAAGEMSKEDAKPLIRQACEEVLADYPDCPAARAARPRVVDRPRAPPDRYRPRAARGGVRAG